MAKVDCKSLWIISDNKNIWDAYKPLNRLYVMAHTFKPFLSKNFSVQIWLVVKGLFCINFDFHLGGTSGHFTWNKIKLALQMITIRTISNDTPQMFGSSFDQQCQCGCIYPEFEIGNCKLHTAVDWWLQIICTTNTAPILTVSCQGPVKNYGLFYAFQK